MTHITHTIQEVAMAPEEQSPQPAEEELTSESLIEEVSIDGMCGVY